MFRNWSLILLIAALSALPGCGGGGGGGGGGSENGGGVEPPIANAGQNQEVLTGTLVTLDSSGSSAASGVLSHRWSFESIPSGSSAQLADQNTEKPTFTADIDGIYVVELTVSNSGLDSKASVTITATSPNTAPSADAGPDQAITTDTTVILDGSASADNEGADLTYSWTFVDRPSGSTATLSSSTSTAPTFDADLDGSYVLQLIVNDGEFDSTADTVTIVAATLNTAPTANAGFDRTVSIGSTVTLDGSASSDNESVNLSYRWSFTALPSGSSATLSSNSSITPSFNADITGDYEIQLTVNDGSLDSNPATVIITAIVANTNTAPTANAGNNQNVVTGTTAILNGGASFDNEANPLTYLWILSASPSGSSSVLSSNTNVTSSLGTDIDGDYVVQLIVNDGQLDSMIDTVTITATTPNTAPSADAGPNQNVNTGVTVVLDGSASADNEGDDLTYSWTFFERPSGSTATLSSSTSIAPTFTADLDGSYVLQLTVNDGEFDSTTDTITITASTPNTAPSADAGPNQNVTTGVTVVLDGSASIDNEGDTLTYSWAFSSRPSGSTATLSSGTSIAPTFTADLDGSYVLQLMVNDGEFDSTADTVTITATTPNTAPSADAGPDQAVTTGTTVILDGSASTDNEGDTLTYSWAFSSRPSGSTATLSASTSIAPTFTADLDGSYVLQLTVNDGEINIATDTVTITATSINTAPTANAGPNQTLLSGSTVTLDGSGSSDNESNPLTYSWSFSTRPSGSSATLSSSTSATPTFDADLDGNYELQLTVNDGALDSSADNVSITAFTASRPANLSCIPPEPVVTPGTVGIEQAFPILPPLTAPVAMVQPPSDSSFWLLALLPGQVYRFDNDDAVNQLDLVLDISDRVLVGSGEFGMTGFAIHPNYPTDNRVFIIYNDNPDNISNGGRSVLAEFTINTATQVIDPDSESTVLILEQPLHFHNGGDLAFGIDGMLYATFGDSEVRAAEAQELDNLWGTVIRIDVSSAPYTVPTDNPFYEPGLARCDGSGATRSGNCPEIFAYGFRNPWRFSIDSLTGQVWVGDVGEDAWEEVDRVDSGGNYGWPIYEGTSCIDGSACDTPGLSLPITVYGRDQGASVVGGYVYRGSLSPSLAGQYIFSDVYTGRGFNIAADSAPDTDLPAAWTGIGSYGMAQGNDGEVYMLSPSAGSAGEMVQRIIGSGGVSIAMETNLSDTGCFDTSTKASEEGVFDYRVNARFWTDGAAKQRSFALPYGSYINVLDDGDYDFPTNTVLIKHFLNEGAYVETRLFINHSVGWRGYSYEWNDAQTDAVLLEDGKTKAIGDYTHIYPSRAQCNSCHLGAANYSLGLEHAQQNLQSDIPGVNMIDFLSLSDYFSTDEVSTGQPKLYDIDDDDATLEQRARSYLHSNCSGCHRPGSVFGDIDLRYYTSLADTNTCGVNPSDGDLGVSGAQRIAPGSPASSVLLLRMQSLDTGQRMPPLGSNVVDQAATQIVSDWIQSLGSCD